MVPGLCHRRRRPWGHSTYGVNAAQINKIFKAYDVFQPGAGGTLTIGIDNPSGYPSPTDPLRPNRQDPNFRNDSSILVISNVADLPYALAVHIDYGAPYQADDYVTYVTITSTSQSVGVWLPDSSLYDTTATLVAGKEGYFNATFATMTGSYYSSHVGLASSLMTTNPPTFVPVVSTQTTMSTTSVGSNPSSFPDWAYYAAAAAAAAVVLAVVAAVILRRPKRSRP